jgi:hypothetical protein
VKVPWKNDAKSRTNSLNRLDEAFGEDRYPKAKVLISQAPDQAEQVQLGSVDNTPFEL